MGDQYTVLANREIVDQLVADESDPVVVAGIEATPGGYQLWFRSLSPDELRRRADAIERRRARAGDPEPVGVAEQWDPTPGPLGF